MPGRRPSAADFTPLVRWLARSLTSSLFITSLNSRLIRCAAMFAMAPESAKTVSTLSLSVEQTSPAALRCAPRTSSSAAASVVAAAASSRRVASRHVASRRVAR